MKGTRQWATEALASDLEVAQPKLRADFDVEGELARLETTLEAGAAAAPRADGVSAYPWLVVVGVAVVVGAVAGASSLAGNDREVEQSVAHQGRPEKETISEPKPARAKAPPDTTGPAVRSVSTLDSPAPSDPHVESLDSTRPTTRSKRPVVVVEVPDPIEREIAHTSKMRAALAKDPARALRLSRSGEREFGKSMFSRERQAYAILAMAALGQQEPARRRAKAFLAQGSEGPLAKRVRRAVDEP